jgi:hypothetical protein
VEGKLVREVGKLVWFCKANNLAALAFAHHREVAKDNFEFFRSLTKKAPSFSKSFHWRTMAAKCKWHARNLQYAIHSIDPNTLQRVITIMSQK